MRKKWVVFFGFIFFAAQVFAETELRIRPRSWNTKTGNGRVKAELYLANPETVNRESITMNGVPSIKTRVGPNKVKAFFYKKDVLATFGEVQRGQTVHISVSFSLGEAAASTTLTGDVRIKGKSKDKEKKSSSSKPQGPS